MEKRDRGWLVTGRDRVLRAGPLGSQRAFWEQLASQLGSVIFIKGPLTCGLGGPPLLDDGEQAAGILLEVFPPDVSRLPLSSGDTYVVGSLHFPGPIVGVRLLLGGRSICMWLRRGALASET
jgi:hypothetical protein